MQSQPIRAERVEAFLAYVAQHGPTYHLRTDFSQFDDLTEAEAHAARDRLVKDLSAEKDKLARINKQRRGGKRR